MSKIVAGITTSVDGYITGPDDGPACGLGVGGERLHYWVFGGPWSYDSPGRGEPAGEDRAWLEETLGANGRGDRGPRHLRGGRALGGKNPWGIPLFVVTHRPGDPSAPASSCPAGSANPWNSSTPECASARSRPSSATA